MIASLRSFREALRHRRRTRRRLPSMSAEALDRRLLLSAVVGHARAGHAAEVRSPQDSEHDGTVVKKPRFYEDYVGPRLAQLDVVAASGQLLPNGNFRFLGVNQGAINPNLLAT
jgi:hypothetical protein